MASGPDRPGDEQRGKFHQARVSELGGELNLYARQLAWLRSPSDPPKRADAPPPSPTHAQLLLDQGQVPAMPAVVAGHLIPWLDQLGWASSSGMGYAPISYSEIDAWARLTQTRLQPWEALALREASAAYVGQLHAGDISPPFRDTPGPNKARGGSFAARAKAFNAAQR